ncbi:MAG: peroxide stress protein YaaA [Burkholderiaceae bacterium]
MLIVLSPAKSLDFESPLPALSVTEPQLEDQAAELAKVLKPMGPAALAKLMGISDTLAERNAARFRAWKPKAGPPVARPALLAFNGDVYEGLNASTLKAKGLAWAQDHVRILSGLYGVLRPLDSLQAYRLEMGTRLATLRGKDLYAFWGHRITDALNEQLAVQAKKSRHAPVLLNLASEEYFKSVRCKPTPATASDAGGPGLQAQVVSPVFEDEKSGSFKIISFYAKRARGLMARFVIDHRIDTPEAVTEFNLEGYRYAADASTPERPVFRRLAKDQPKA